MTRELAAVLQGWKLIGGFHYNSDLEITPTCLNDLTENGIGDQWGSLVNFLSTDESSRFVQIDISTWSLVVWHKA